MLEKMQEIGITTPTAGQVTGNPVMQLAEQALSAMPTSTKTMQAAARQTVNEMDDFAATLTYRYGGARTYAGAADDLLTAAKRADDRFKTKSAELYNKAGSLLPENSFSNASGVSEFVNKYRAVADTDSLQKTYATSIAGA